MGVVERAGKILMVSIVLLSVLVIFLSFVHHYAKCRPSTTTHRRRRRGDFTAGYQENPSGVTVLRRGLDPSFLKTIPIIPFDPKDFKEGLECAVCLSDVGEGEKTRVLPKCNHGFHVECIDMWFYSHSTCPICRNPVSADTADNLLESQTDFPTNILFWGDETEVSTLTSQLEEAANTTTYHQTPSAQMRPDHLVIDIPLQLLPRQIDCDNGDEKSPSPSPVSTSRITRILSGSRRFINPFSHAVDQGHL